MTGPIAANASVCAVMSPAVRIIVVGEINEIFCCGGSYWISPAVSIRSAMFHFRYPRPRGMMGNAAS